MEEELQTWPPPPATPQAQETPRTARTPIRWAMIAGLFAGLAFYGGVWQWAYQDCTSPSAGGCWLVQLPLGLSVPMAVQFVAYLGVGLFLLFLLGILLRRPFPTFVRGLAMASMPCVLTFLYVLSLYVLSVPAAIVKGGIHF